VRQSSHALVYPLVVGLGVAAAIPLSILSLGAGASPPPAPAVTPVAAKRIVVASTRDDPFDAPAPAPTPGAAQPARAAASGDDRWWRAQLDRLATMSIVRLPSGDLRAGPPPIVDRAQREAAARDAAAAARADPALPLSDGVTAGQAMLAASQARLSDRVPAAIRRWEPLILRAAHRYNLDPALIAALMQTESGGNPQAVSPMNAIGLLQVLNGPFDPETNVDQGSAMLAGHIKRFGSINLALAAYNAGPNAVLQYGGMPPYEETYNHVTRTLASWAAFRG
jgi:soluble lytic murein transglycosylase-like protein